MEWEQRILEVRGLKSSKVERGRGTRMLRPTLAPALGVAGVLGRIKVLNTDWRGTQGRGAGSGVAWSPCGKEPGFAQGGDRG